MPSLPGAEGAGLTRAFHRARRSTKMSNKRQPNGHQALHPPNPDFGERPTRAPAHARQQLYADGKHAEILADIEACLPKDEAGNFVADQEKSDVVHDLLAFLAERMMEMNKQKQQEIEGFMGWLEGYVGAKVEDLTPNTVACRATTNTIMIAI